MTRAEQVWIWLSLTRGLGPGRARQLVEYFGGEEPLWNAEEETLRAEVEEPWAERLLAARDEEAIDAHVRACRAQGMQVLTPASPLYPPLLREIYDPPCALYALGDVSLLNTACLTIVGTRRHTRYGVKITAMLAEELSRAGLTIVSGLTEGLGERAHRAALDAGGRTIAVLANGLDVHYPGLLAELQGEIAQKGLLVSEWPPGVRADKRALLMRNRLLAGLSRGTLVTEAGARSGTLLVAELAAEYGRELFAVPGNIDSPASYAVNRLMRTSAEIVLEARDVLDALGLPRQEAAPRERAQPRLTEQEEALVRLVRHEPLSFDELAERTQLPAAKLNSLLTMLQLKGIIDQTAGRVVTTKS